MKSSVHLLIIFEFTIFVLQAENAKTKIHSLQSLYYLYDSKVNSVSHCFQMQSSQNCWRSSLIEKRGCQVRWAKGYKAIFQIFRADPSLCQDEKFTKKAKFSVLYPLCHFCITKFVSISHWVTESDKFSKKANICFSQPHIYRFDNKLATISHWITRKFPHSYCNLLKNRFRFWHNSESGLLGWLVKGCKAFVINFRVDNFCLANC